VCCSTTTVSRTYLLAVVVCATVMLTHVISLILVIHCVLSVAVNTTPAVTSVRGVVLALFRSRGDPLHWTLIMPVNVRISLSLLVLLQQALTDKRVDVLTIFDGDNDAVIPR